jgi:hypothetical protein
MIIAAFHDQLLQAATPIYGFAVPAPLHVISGGGCIILSAII